MLNEEKKQKSSAEVAGRCEFTLLGCPFCGSKPIFPEIKDVYGTCYDAGCEDCGVATISIQMIDCFDYGESPNREDAHNSWDDQEMKYGDAFIEVVRNEAIAMWNNRATGDDSEQCPDCNLGTIQENLECSHCSFYVG